MNHPFLISLKRMKRDSDDCPQLFIYIDHKYFCCTFCVECGNYLEGKTENVKCMCDQRETYFRVYKNFFETFSDSYGGDIFDDYLENSEQANPMVMNYMYRAILFGISYKEKCYNNIDDNIVENVISFLV